VLDYALSSAVGSFEVGSGWAACFSITSNIIPTCTTCTAIQQDLERGRGKGVPGVGRLLERCCHWISG
jgi:hypothetical protein